MSRFADFGNDLYSGRRSFAFVPKRRLWLAIAAVLVVISFLIPVVKGGFNLGIDFTGGSEFTISSVTDEDPELGQQALNDTGAAEGGEVTNIAPGTMRAQTAELDDQQTLVVGAALADAYGVSQDEVTSSFVGPTWGAGISQQMLRGLVIFLVLTAVLMAVYFRTWKMSVASMAGVFVTVALTVGTYSLVGFEVTPSAIIGFLTVLSYSLYDTVVVFDKVRENTKGLLDGTAPEARRRRGFLPQINLAANQTLVRSINTSIVGLLPVGSILFIGAALLGAGTLKDLALSQFVGIVYGTLATLFVATPLYAMLRAGEPAVRELDARAAATDPETDPDDEMHDADDSAEQQSEEGTRAPVAVAAARPWDRALDSSATAPAEGAVDGAAPGGTGSSRAS